MDWRRVIIRYLIFILIPSCLFWFYRRQGSIAQLDGDDRPFTSPDVDIDSINRVMVAYLDKPIHSPYKYQFWEIGQRLKTLTLWYAELDQLNNRAPERRDIIFAIEAVSTSLMPFLGSIRTTSLHDLRSSFVPGSRGIVIPAGGGADSLRFACHLITSLRFVLGCELLIQIAFAGDHDLSQKDRDRIASIDGVTDVSFLDVLSVFDDAGLKLVEGGWAIKPFAALASHFEQIILMDADAVFLQKPDVLFDQQAFDDNGALLFHDRLLWQHAFRGRHDWYKDQIREPSPAMLTSLVWMADYAEECDSGVVVLDKSRVEVLMGLLHTAWQNTYEVRNEITYKLTYGEKESWWLGLELAGSSYAFEGHYGSILGWEGYCDTKKEDGNNDEKDKTCVCSFVIAHVDDDGELIWYNGSLLKNKLTAPHDYEVPEV